MKCAGGPATRRELLMSHPEPRGPACPSEEQAGPQPKTQFLPSLQKAVTRSLGCLSVRALEKARSSAQLQTNPGWVSPPTLRSHGPLRGHHHSAHTKRQCVCCSGSLTNRGVSQELDLVGGIPGSPTGTQSRLTRGNEPVSEWMGKETN